jgi:hypothetical protein
MQNDDRKGIIEDTISVGGYNKTIAYHDFPGGKSFAFDYKSKFCVFGGKTSSRIVDFSCGGLDNVVQEIPINKPFKWSINSYEWDPLQCRTEARFLQTRNKIIEIINVETNTNLLTLKGHGRIIDESKW